MQLRTSEEAAFSAMPPSNQTGIRSMRVSHIFIHLAATMQLLPSMSEVQMLGTPSHACTQPFHSQAAAHSPVEVCQSLLDMIPLV